MERLTERAKNGKPVFTSMDACLEGINRLAEYEDLEEAGLLKRFPCKIGDEIFVIESCIDKDQKYYAIGTWTVFGIEINRHGTIMFHLGHQGCSDYHCAYLSEIGNKWTTTYEAAEKRLEEIKQEDKYERR